MSDPSIPVAEVVQIELETMNALRVLLVEDSEDDAALLRRHLVRGGYDPYIARVESAQEMDRLLDEQPWDLVIADYTLPQFSAVQALSLLQAKELDFPFLILSGTIGEETAVEAMRAGAHDYVMKGKSARLLPAIVRELREARGRETRRVAQRALRENERRFRALIEHSSDITTVVDVDGHIRYVSPSMQRLLGHSVEFLTGTKLQDHVHPDDVAIILQLIGQSVDDAPKMVEFRFAEPGGDWRSFEATVTNLLDNTSVGGIVFNCRDVTSRKQDEATIRHLAYYDALTALPNRLLFKDRLAQAIALASRRGSRGLAIMFIDLDRFKTINDTLGHGIGDELLRAAASRLRDALRHADTVARLGGDEFLFLLPGVDEADQAARLGQKIVDLFNEPFHIHGHELHITTSAGMSLFPSDAQDGETLIRNADTALYRAKEQGRNRCQLYAPAMNAFAARRLMLENNLRRALDRGELVLFYQPLVSLERGDITGVEALIRWKHPELGDIAPAEFIPIAEETGLIVPLSRWIFRTAFTQMREWLDAGATLQTMSVNVSARRFNDSNLPSIMAEVLEEARLDGGHVSLELTEGVMLEDAEATILTLKELKKLGVKISIDDFGTGYSSLSYLKRLPIDTLKIDRSFVRHIPSSDDSAIAMLIISMAHNLNLTVVAEGVETEEQRAFLRTRNCDTMQGFLVSQPLASEGMTELLIGNRSHSS
jgi:diguanylate cyclase (GGDEF)-like protein/PAS domain S-box-containing protein